MPDEFTQQQPEIPRDRWGRPMVVPPAGGKPVAYTRATTFVGAIEDTYNLQRWQQRMVALGLADRPDLVLSVAAHRQDKDHLNKVCEEAAEAAKAHAAATTGTALHALTESMDRGLDLGVVPEAYAADLEAYAQATKHLAATHIEQFCVNDAYRIGGTPDRVVRFQGKRYIADLKTGSIQWGYLKIAAQLAVYARSKPYDVVTHERGMHGAEIDRGIVIHLPAGSGTCSLYWVDLTKGWEAVQLSRQVRDMRAIPSKALLEPLDAPPPTEAPRPQDPTVEQQIDTATTPEQVRDLWRVHNRVWTQHHTDLAAQKIAALEMRQDETRQGATP